jgi:predicted XRE-type DNA-binding protein
MPRDPRILELRRQLAREITRAVGPLGAEVVTPAYGISQPRMSELAREQVDRHTVEWLIRRIHAMGGTVTLSIELGNVAEEWRRERFRGMAARRATLMSKVE